MFAVVGILLLSGCLADPHPNRQQGYMFNPFFGNLFGQHTYPALAYSGTGFIDFLGNIFRQVGSPRRSPTTAAPLPSAIATVRPVTQPAPVSFLAVQQTFPLACSPLANGQTGNDCGLSDRKQRYVWDDYQKRCYPGIRCALSPAIYPGFDNDTACASTCNIQLPLQCFSIAFGGAYGSQCSLEDQQARYVWNEFEKRCDLGTYCPLSPGVWPGFASNVSCMSSCDVQKPMECYPVFTDVMLGEECTWNDQKQRYVWDDYQKSCDPILFCPLTPAEFPGFDTEAECSSSCTTQVPDQCYPAVRDPAVGSGCSSSDQKQRYTWDNYQNTCVPSTQCPLSPPEWPGFDNEAMCLSSCTPQQPIQCHPVFNTGSYGSQCSAGEQRLRYMWDDYDRGCNPGFYCPTSPNAWPGFANQTECMSSCDVRKPIECVSVVHSGMFGNDCQYKHRYVWDDYRKGCERSSYCPLASAVWPGFESFSDCVNTCNTQGQIVYGPPIGSA